MEVTLRPALAALGALALLSCGGADDPASRKRVGVTPADCPSMDRPSITLEDQPPRVAPPADPADWDTLPVPMTLVGEDTGSQSVAYGTLLMGTYLIGVQKPADCTDELKPTLPCTPFAYEVDPRTGTATDHESLARQIVATLTQTWMYRVTGRPEFRRSADAALDMLTPRVKRSPRTVTPRGARGGTKLENMGVTSLLSMAIAQHQVWTGDTSRDGLLRELGQWLLDRVEEDGEIRQGSALKKMQMHNALWRIYEATGDLRYLDALERVARWDLDHRTELVAEKQLFHFPYLYGLWVHEPLTELYIERPQPWIAELVFSVADEVIDKQYTWDDAPTCSHVGGFRPSSGKGHPNWNHTLKLEAVVDAWRMADRAGDAERKARYAERAKMAADFLLRFQHRKGELEGWAGADQVVGGVPLFISKPQVRVDVPGHGGVAMAKYVEYFETDTLPGRPTPVARRGGAGAPPAPPPEAPPEVEADQPAAPAE